MNNKTKNKLEVTKIGTWDWNLETNQIIYNKQWAKIYGYSLKELSQTEETWQNIIHPDDLCTIKEKLALYLKEKTSSFSIDFRAIRKNKKIIWIRDNIIIVDYTKKHLPLRIMGVTQDISSLKNVEINLLANQAKLDMIMNAVSLATWECVVLAKQVKYNQEFLNMLGYSDDEITGCENEWQNMYHFDDLQITKKQVASCLENNTEVFENEIRLKHKNGTYIWTRFICAVLEYDENDKPTRIIGTHLNIDNLKLSQKYLEKSLTEIKEHDISLESKLLLQIKTFTEQNNNLWRTNEIAQILLSMNINTDFQEIVYRCLKILGEITNQNRTYIWKSVLNKDGENCCIQINEWVQGVDSIKGIIKYEYVPYAIMPTFSEHLNSGKCLNSFVKNLSSTERDLLESQDIKTILIVPINIRGENWGFMGIDNCETYELFTPFEEKMTLMSGVFIANAIEKYTNFKALQEAEERNTLTLNSMPLSYSCWTSDLKQIMCNDEAVRLLGLSSQQEYLDHFYELAPLYQANGQFSSVMALEKIKKAFETGYERFDWLYKTLKDEIIPTEVTLVRIKYKDDYVVNGYARDLRETKEAEEHLNLIINSMPLCIHLWDRNLINRTCNDEAVRLFGLSSQQEYLDRFNDLSPLYQPDGQKSKEKISSFLPTVFDTGYARFEWMHQTLDGKPIPTEITLVRIKYKDDYLVAGYTRDLRETKEIEEQNYLMLNSMPLAANWWTRELENINCNDEALRLFNMPSREEYLANWHKLSPLHQPDGQQSKDAALNIVTKAFDTGYERFEWMHQTLEGEPLPTEVILSRIKFEDDYIVLGYIRDLRETKAVLNEMKKVETALRLAHEEVLISSKAKTNFLANMSHEIRTPLNAISGLAEIILRENEKKSISEHASEIKNACTSLIGIVNDILDISKIESGKLEIVNSEYNLSSLINDTINISRVRLGTKPLIFTANIDSKLPSILFGDEIRIKQILINFLTNAIKFTQEGQVHLEVSGTFSKNKADLQFSITDTGVGIKKEDMKLLFAQFERINTTKNRNIEGTGLGLAISKRLTDMMKGTMTVDTTFGKGSTFTVIIPQEYSNYIPVAEIKTRKNVLLYESRDLYASSIKKAILNLGSNCDICVNQSELHEHTLEKNYDFIFTNSFNAKKVKNLLKKKKNDTKIVLLANFGENSFETDVYTLFLPITCLPIASILENEFDSSHYGTNKTGTIEFIAREAKVLIVDDNQVNLKVAAGLMEPYQFQIDTAVNGYEAIKKIKTKKYDLVFMDHMMPEMDGIDATIAIRIIDGAYYKNLPIIALTANAIVGSKEMFLKEGMNDFLAKPIEISKLNSIISKWIPEEKKQKLEKRNPIEHLNYNISIEGLDTISGLASVGGSIENYSQILSIFYAEGLEKSFFLQKLLDSQNIQRFKIEIHALKSSSKAIGASVLSSMARRLEDAAEINNIFYINGNINEFIKTLNMLLSNMKLYLDKYTEEKKLNISSKNINTQEYLQSQLVKLSNAIEFINISDIEAILNEILTFDWHEEIVTMLNNIQDAILYFDYDKALDIVHFLQKK